MDLIYKEEVYSIIGAAMEVHKELGDGFLESVYKEALEKEFILKSIPYKREQPLIIYYKNEPLNKYFIADFICYDNIIVELKAVSELIAKNEGQIVNYLSATGLKLGILINFGKKSLEYKRIIK